MFWVQGYLPPTKNGVEPKRPSRPINITSLVRLSTTVPNTIVVSWTSEIGRVRRSTQSFMNQLSVTSVWLVLLNVFFKYLFCQSFSMAVYLVRQQSSAVLLQRLRAKGIRNPDHSRALSKLLLTFVVKTMCCHYNLKGSRKLKKTTWIDFFHIVTSINNFCQKKRFFQKFLCSLCKHIKLFLCHIFALVLQKYVASQYDVSLHPCVLIKDYMSFSIWHTFSSRYSCI